MVRVVHFGRCLAAAALFGFLSLGVAVQPPSAVAQDVARTTVVPMDKALSSSTILYVQVENAKQFAGSRRGQPVWQAAAPTLPCSRLLEDVKKRLEEASEQATAQVGMSLEELLELPQGPMTVALMPRPEGGEHARLGGSGGRRRAPTPTRWPRSWTS